MICILCLRREAEHPQVCDPCRLWLPTVLRDIGEGYAQLDVAPIDDSADQRAPDIIILSSPGKHGRRRPLPLHDPIRQALPSAARGQAGAGEKVTGGREEPIPVSLDLVDLTAPARAGSLLPHANAELHQHAAIVARTRTLERHEYAAAWTDQIGHLSVATELEQWVIDWIYARDQHEHRPRPVVGELVTWLANRIPWACDHHPAVDEFAVGMKHIRSTLRALVLGRPETPQKCEGVPCSGCDMLTLHQHPGSQWRAECGNPDCRKVLTEQEFHRWTGLIAKGRRKMDITLTVNAPYWECGACRHPGPPEPVCSVTFAQPSGAHKFVMIPHRRDCSTPNPFNGPSATIMIDDAASWAKGAA